MLLELAREFAPVRVCYRFGQRRVADHVLHFEGFDANNMVFVNQFAGLLVQVIQSAIGNFCVEPGNL